MSRLLSILFLLLQSVAAGYGLLLISECAWSWYHGGSPDPRCVRGWHGYVETHHLDEGGQVSCDYRPDITDAPR